MIGEIRMPCASKERCYSLRRGDETANCGMAVGLSMGNCERMTLSVAEAIRNHLRIEGIIRLQGIRERARVFISRKEDPSYKDWDDWDQIAEIRRGLIIGIGETDLSSLDLSGL